MKRILIPILTCIAAMSYAQTMPNNIVNVDNDEYATQPWVVTNSTGVATNTGANGNVLTKNGTDVYWSAAGVGDAVLAGNQVFTGSNQFTGKLQITTNTPTAAQVAKYNATSGKWYAAPDTGGSDTTFTNYLAGSGFVTITGAARSGSNTINGVANAAFTNAVQAAQTNVVDTTYTAGTNLDLNGTQFDLDAAAQASDALADSAMQDLIDDTSPTLGGNLDADDKTLNNMGILYDGNGAGAGMNFSGSVFWDSGGNNWIDGEDRKLVGVGSVDILGWTATRLYVMNAAGQNIADNDVVSVDGSPANNEAGVWTANGMDGKSEAEFKSLFNMEAGTDYALPTALLSGIYTQSFATNISYNMGYKIAGQLTVTNTVTFDVADAQPLHPFNFIIYGTNTVTMDSNLTLFGSWTQAATNVLSFTPKETGQWFYSVATP